MRIFIPDNKSQATEPHHSCLRMLVIAVLPPIGARAANVIKALNAKWGQSKNCSAVQSSTKNTYLCSLKFKQEWNHST